MPGVVPSTALIQSEHLSGTEVQQRGERSHGFAQTHLRLADLAVDENDQRLAHARPGLNAAIEHLLLEGVAAGSDFLQLSPAQHRDAITAVGSARVVDRQSEQEAD